MIYLNSEPYKRFYHADKWSCATVFCGILLAGVIIIPIFLGLATDNFWLAQLEYTETPTVLFRNEVIIFNFQNGNSYGYSSNSQLNNLFANKIAGASIRSTPTDSNQDGKPESFTFEISIQTDPTTLTMSQIYLFFDYGLKDNVRLQMQDFIKVEFSSSDGIRKASATGSIAFKQANPIQSSKIARSVYNTSVFSESLQNLNLISLESRKALHNETLYCSGCTQTSMSGSGSTVDIIIELDVPAQQSVWYVPTLFHNIKFAWVQYIFLFVPLYVLIRFIIQFAFSNKIFDVHESNDLPYKKNK